MGGVCVRVRTCVRVCTCVCVCTCVLHALTMTPILPSPTSFVQLVIACINSETRDVRFISDPRTSQLRPIPMRLEILMPQIEDSMKRLGEVQCLTRREKGGEVL